MIVIKCDLCGKKAKDINTLILYRKKIDYCNKCVKKINKIRKEFVKEVKYQQIFFNSALKDKENKLIKEYKK